MACNLPEAPSDPPSAEEPHLGFPSHGFHHQLPSAADSPASRRGELEEVVVMRNPRLCNMRKQFQNGASCCCSDEMVVVFFTFMALVMTIVISFTSPAALALGGLMPHANSTDNTTHMLHHLHSAADDRQIEEQVFHSGAYFPRANVSMGNLSGGYYPDISPSPWWSVVMWAVCYWWQLVWLVCAFFSACFICRKVVEVNKLDNLFREPDMVYLLYVCSLMCSVGWMMFFYRNQQWAGLLLLFGSSVANCVCFGASLYAFRLRLDELPSGDTPGVWLAARIGLVRLVNHNGMAAYISWLWFATLVNMAVVIFNYDNEVSMVAAGSVALAVFFMSFLVWCVLDLIFFDRYTRYVVAPHVTVLITLAAVVQQNWSPKSVNAVLAVVLMALTFIALCMKVAVMIYRHMKTLVENKRSTPRRSGQALIEDASAQPMSLDAAQPNPDSPTGAKPQADSGAKKENERPSKKTTQPKKSGQPKKTSPSKKEDEEPLIAPDSLEYLLASQVDPESLPASAKNKEASEHKSSEMKSEQKRETEGAEPEHVELPESPEGSENSEHMLSDEPQSPHEGEHGRQ